MSWLCLFIWHCLFASALISVAHTLASVTTGKKNDYRYTSESIPSEIRYLFHENIVEQSPDLFDELDAYVAAHNKKAVLTDPNICNRQFATAVYACPQQVGNHMHEFLNNLIASFVTNRTVMWHFCERKVCQLDNQWDCNLYLKRLSWMPSMVEVQKKLDEEKCKDASFPKDKVVESKFRWQAHKMLMCCGIDKILDKWVDFGTHELHEMLSLNLNNARLGHVARRKAQLLFSRGEDFAYGVMFRMSFKWQHSVIANNDAVIEEGLMRLAQKGVDVNSDTTNIGGESENNNNNNNNNDKKVSGKNRKTPLLVGLHLRHSSEHGEWEKKSPLDYYRSQHHCVKKLIETRIDSGDACIILLATDRPNTIERYHNMTAATDGHYHSSNNGNHVNYNKNNYNNISGSSGDTGTRHEGMFLKDCVVVTTNHSLAPTVHINRIEHGPFTGMMAMLDLELVSRSDVFLGSAYDGSDPHLKGLVSTFSMLIAALRATRGHLPTPATLTTADATLTTSADGNSSSSSLSSSLLKADMDTRSSASTWLPSCGPMLGAKHIPDELFTDPPEKAFRCRKWEEDHVLIQPICPYFHKNESDIPLD